MYSSDTYLSNTPSPLEKNKMEIEIRGTKLYVRHTLLTLRHDCALIPCLIEFSNITIYTIKNSKEIFFRSEQTNSYPMCQVAIEWIQYKTLFFLWKNANTAELRSYSTICDKIKSFGINCNAFYLGKKVIHTLSMCYIAGLRIHTNIFQQQIVRFRWAISLIAAVSLVSLFIFSTIHPIVISRCFPREDKSKQRSLLNKLFACKFWLKPFDVIHQLIRFIIFILVLPL